MADVSNIDNKESDNAFEGSDDIVITNTDVNINDLYKLKTKVMALKMFITDQLYLLKQSIGNPKTPDCNCNSKCSSNSNSNNNSNSNCNIASLIEQTHYVKQEHKMKKLFYSIFSLSKFLYQSS